MNWKLKLLLALGLIIGVFDIALGLTGNAQATMLMPNARGWSPKVAGEMRRALERDISFEARYNEVHRPWVRSDHCVLRGRFAICSATVQIPQAPNTDIKVFMYYRDQVRLAPLRVVRSEFQAFSAIIEPSLFQQAGA